MSQLLQETQVIEESDGDYLRSLITQSKEGGRKFSPGTIALIKSAIIMDDIDTGRKFYGTNKDGERRLFTRKREPRQPRRKVEGVPLCGAQTRKGTPCQCLPVEGKERCKYHGGASTGPRTAEGRARIAESNRRRARTKLGQYQ